MEATPILEMYGKTFVSAEKTSVDEADELVFTTAEGHTMRFYHEQDCCENVSIEDICGDLSDLCGSPMLLAEETSERKESDDGSCTWTFYRFRTNKGSVTVRWVGESNGYYSESVDREWEPAKREVQP